ncbi:protein-tyrosine phosphatase-like protein [Pseudomassariella vexata]|uniref:Protein-tyrosine phosphatase-like protein n=1 Tax=Pseudomassariella vexata TaxID=1141098 RepID=A0A1Y2EB45_9PEZI|nr:protein-tyrosine phosphatase-like protein [Pseudomassariella vexata]ORY68782.1 protein-tyrosine phosphatase-like protein [Pseudomassariella vexata]
MSTMADTVTLLKLAETDVAQEIPKEQFGPVILQPPFVFVDGTFNTRDLGLVPNSPLRANFAYRSGSLSHLTDNGKAVLAGKLGIKRIFDLRSPKERKHDPDPIIPDIENTWIQSSRPDSHLDLNKFLSGGGEVGYEEMYLEVVDFYQPAWKVILEHVKDRPQDPFLVHCVAGRDRTGVLGGLLLTLAGASPDVVTLDYLLSRIGTEPVRKRLLAFAMAGTSAESEEQPGFYNMCSLRASCWNAFIAGLQREYGGYEQFVIDKLGFSGEDLAKIKANLTSPSTKK